jgi:ribosomal protein S18 acetylase RimI-like enzyme
MSDEEFIPFLTRFLLERVKKASLDKENVSSVFDSLTPLFFPDEKISFELIPQIGLYDEENRKKIKHQLQLLIEKNPGMAVAGRYSLHNYVSRPTALFILIKQKNQIDENNALIGLLNFTIKSQIIPLVSSELFKATKTIEILLQLLENLVGYFIFTAGDEFISLLSRIYCQDIQMHNNVYHFTDPGKNAELLARITLDSQYTMILFDEKTINNPNIVMKLPLLRDFYHYKFLEADLIQKINQSPHCLIIDTQSQPIAGCRANAFSKEFAIIGGVFTDHAHRRKGIGKYMCNWFIAYLLQHVQDIFLDTDEKNLPARKIYESIGFKQVGHSLFIDHGSGVVKGILAERDY